MSARARPSQADVPVSYPRATRSVGLPCVFAVGDTKYPLCLLDTMAVSEMVKRARPYARSVLRVSRSRSGEIGGKISGAGQSRAVHEDGNDADASLERLCDFETDKVLIVVKTSAAIDIDRGQPTSPDHRDERVHFAE